MNGSGFASFATAIGRCAVAWRPRGLISVRLPSGKGESTLFTDADEAPPPAAVAAVIGKIVAHLSGDGQNFSLEMLDLSMVGEFEAAVYRLALAIPAGQTRTYGELAAELGGPNHARAVGQALGRNPWPVIVPCHRITAADGRTGGFSAPGGASTKLRLLEIEGALAVEALPLFSLPQS